MTADPGRPFRPKPRRAKKSARPLTRLLRLAGILGAVIVSIIVTQLLLREVILWAQLLVASGVVLVAGLVLGQVHVVPRLSRKASRHPRTTSTEAWESLLTPEQALARIREELGPTVTCDGPALQATVGSDVTFRRRGAGSEAGWRALPLLVTFRADPSSTGCRITAEARDDLGWYPEPPAACVEDGILRRSTALIQQAMRATGRSAHRP